MTKTTSRTLVAISVSIGIFVFGALMPKLLITDKLIGALTSQGLELSLSLLAIVILGKSKFSEYGFCLPSRGRYSESRIRWGFISLAALPLGAGASLIMLGLGGSGNPMAKSLTLPQIILMVFIFSSIIEEIFTRGFLQSHLSVLSGRSIRLFLIRIELPVFISGLIFACMHFSLLLMGVDRITMTVIFFFTFFVGLIAGYIRQETGSLIPAILAHMLANLGGMIGGILYKISSS